MQIEEGRKPLKDTGLLRARSTLMRVMKYEDRGFQLVNRRRIEEVLFVYVRDNC